MPDLSTHVPTTIGFPTPPPTTKFQTYNFEEKHVLIPWRSTEVYGPRKQAPLPPSAKRLNAVCGHAKNG